MRLSRALEAFYLSLNGSKSPATLVWYKRKLTSLTILGDVDIKKINLHDLRRWRAELAERKTKYTSHPTRREENEGLSTWTLHGYVRAVRHLFKWLTDEGLIPRNPAARLELPQLPNEPRKGISQTDLQKILDVARDHPRDYALCLFLADTACRVGGLCNLTLADLDLERGRATVREKGLGGEQKSRTVYLTPRTCDALRAWLAARPASNDNDNHVFIGQRGGLTPSGVYQIVKRLARAAGVTRNWNPHNWRHGAARAMLQNGASLAHISQLLGHEDVSTTARFYGTFADEELKAAHDKYTWISNGENSAGD